MQDVFRLLDYKQAINRALQFSEFSYLKNLDGVKSFNETVEIMNNYHFHKCYLLYAKECLDRYAPGENELPSKATDIYEKVLAEIINQITVQMHQNLYDTEELDIWNSFLRFWIKNTCSEFKLFKKHGTLETISDSLQTTDGIGKEFKEKNLTICRKCGGKCTTGKVLKNKTIVSSFDEFGGTMSDRGFPQILNCFKCESCGHSFISKKN